LLAIILGIYSFIATIIVSICAGLPDINGPVLISGLLQNIGLSICIYIVVLPIITVCSRKPGLFMGGAVIAFITGYCILFFKQGLLRNIYPFSAALTLIGFDTSSYVGAEGKGSILLSIASLSIMLLAAILLICTSSAPGDIQNSRNKNRKGISLRPAQREKTHKQ
ncbi:MAG: ABC transporter permease, partial [Eubacteriales bacterium]|nr:ABC transporter permease [Eubacteriales bacterium]